MTNLCDRLILDSGASAILLRQSALHLLMPHYTVGPLPPLTFQTPTCDLIHATTGGHLLFPHHPHSIPCYVLPDAELSHSLLSVSALLGPHSRAVFTPYTVQFFDHDNLQPYLTGHKLPQESLWSLHTTPPPLAASLPTLAEPATPPSVDNLALTLGEQGERTLDFLQPVGLEFGLLPPRPVSPHSPPPKIGRRIPKAKCSMCFRHHTQYT